MIDATLPEPINSRLDASEDLPDITCDMSNHEEVEYLIKQNITDKQRSSWQLTPERYKKILELVSLRGLLPRDTAVREKLENHPGVIACRSRLEFAMKQYAAQMLSLKENQVFNCQINKSLYSFSVANADEKSRTLLLQLYTDPRLMPYATQLALGQRSIPPEVMDLLPDLDPDDSPKCLGVYFIVVIINFFKAAMITERTDQKHPQHAIYAGSAISDDGFARRIPNHEAQLQLGWKEVVKGFFAGNPSILRVHLAMAKHDSKYSYKWAYQLPAIDDSQLRPLARMSVALLEAIVIGEGTLGDHISGRLPRIKSQSHVLSKRMRRNGTSPFDGWTGLNSVSPAFQDTNPGFHISLLMGNSSRIWQPLTKHYEDKHELYLERDVAERLDEQFRPNRDESNIPGVELVRMIYAKVLESYGQKYVLGAGLSGDRNKAIALTAIIQQANKDGLINGPTTNGRYEMSGGTIDWERASHRAQNLVPAEDMSSHTPEILGLVFQRCKLRMFGQRSLLDECLTGQNFHKIISKQFSDLSENSFGLTLCSLTTPNNPHRLQLNVWVEVSLCGFSI
jgi:hypothetical protein